VSRGLPSYLTSRASWEAHASTQPQHDAAAATLHTLTAAAACIACPPALGAGEGESGESGESTAMQKLRIVTLHRPHGRWKTPLPSNSPHDHMILRVDLVLQKLRIVTLSFGTARQRMVLERWTNPNPQRRTRSPRYEVPSCRRKSAGVA
jgi:hypothetical protein